MSAPIDQPQRERFINALDQNFSVVASAGSGKTRAITERIAAIARSPRAKEILPALVIVTFTNRAADEMQQRARQRMLEERVPLDALAAFNRAFFGTIHSFCVKLLRQHGHHLGLPGNVDLIGDDSLLWMEFVQQQTTIGAHLTDSQRRCLQRLTPMRDLMELGRGTGTLRDLENIGEFPALDFRKIYAAIGNGNSRSTIAKTQERLRAWERGWRDEDGFLPLPECGTSAKEFIAIWDSELRPLREWLRRCSLASAAEIARDYRAFRLTKGAMNYDDQIALASELMRVPEAARRIRERGFRVILDEAQDTDPTQFDVLLSISRPPNSTTDWPISKSDPPRPGHFSMVGDFQQSIFGERADLSHYRRIHEALTSSTAGESVTFSVTFRLDQTHIDFVNEIFPRVLDRNAGQVPFVKLSARPAALPGQIARFAFDDSPAMDNWNDFQRAQFESRALAAWLRNQGLKRLRARSWRDVAILCPRKDWFAPLHDALRTEGFDVQIQSERDIKGESPAYAWFTALAVIMAAPRNAYEIVGVLREIFGMSDHDLAAFSKGDGSRFQIARSTLEGGPVAEKLRLLFETRERIAMLPLFSAMQEIVIGTRLADRLAALPAEDSWDSQSELDDLLTLAANAETDGKTLANFADDLRANFNSTREVRTSVRDAIQLITIHKAKGSEWQAVIVPFFAREPRKRSRRYPRLLRHPTSGAIHAALCAEDIRGELKELLDAESLHETKRLLYVALTRAKHTLVLAHDHAIFSGKNGLKKNAPALLLGCGDCAPFAALPDALESCEATHSRQIEDATRRADDLAILSQTCFAGDSEISARTRATLFIKRNPSALAESVALSAEFARRNSIAPNPGARYGTWWHEFVQRLDWRGDPADWNAIFQEARRNSPDANLSDREWKLLREQLSGSSELARIFKNPAMVAHAEMPFLWAMNSRECLDGIIDLAIFDAASESCLVLDWKTNRPTEAGSAKLRENYLPQLSAYWHALSKMTGLKVGAGIYSTATAEWLPYETAELADAWRSIENRPEAIASALAVP